MYVFLRRIVISNHKNFLLHLFLKNGQVQYSFENKAYLKPCIYMKKDNYYILLLLLLLLLLIIVSSEESDYRHSALIGWNTANN